MSIEALKQQARRHEQKEEWQKALDQYRKAINALAKDDQTDIGLINRVGDLYVRVGKLDDAVEHYEQAVDLYREAFLPNNAIAVCKKVIRNVPDRHRAYLKIGQIRAEQGFLSDARANFLTYAERMQQGGDLDESFRALVEFCDLAQDDVDVRITVADQMAANERTEEAVEQLLVAYRQLSQSGEADMAGGVERKIHELDPSVDVDAAIAAAGTAFGASGDSGFETGFGEIDLGGPAEPEPAEAAADSEGVGAFEISGSDDAEAADVTASLEDASEEEGAELPMMGFGEEEEEEATEPPMMGFGDEDGEEATELPIMGFGDEDEEEGAELPIMGFGDEDEEEATELPTIGFGEDEDEDEEAPELSTMEGTAGEGWHGLGSSDPESSESPGEAGEEEGEGPISGATEALEDAVEEGAPEAAPALEETPPAAAHGAGAPATPPQSPEPAPPVDDYVDLGAMILGGGATQEKTTRFKVAYEEPSGDEEADFAKMLSQFKEKVSENLDSDDVRAHYDLGTAYKEMGLLEEAISAFQQALRASSDHLPTYEMMGQTFIEMGNPEAAVKTLERALRIPTTVEDDFVGIYYYLARAFQALDNKTSALEYYDRVFALDINFADVTERLRELR